MMQSENDRRAYLRAMGIDVWIPRDQPDAGPECEPSAARDGAEDYGWDELRAAVAACTRCRLSEGRTNAVPGEGSPDTEVVFVGEGPGQNEDRQGRPFVGAAGNLLQELLGMIGWGRDDVFITNVVKCRPPDNRNPEPEEIVTCLPFLRGQIELVAHVFGKDAGADVAHVRGHLDAHGALRRGAADPARTEPIDPGGRRGGRLGEKPPHRRDGRRAVEIIGVGHGEGAAEREGYVTFYKRNVVIEADQIIDGIGDYLRIAQVENIRELIGAAWRVS